MYARGDLAPCNGALIIVSVGGSHAGKSLLEGDGPWPTVPVARKCGGALATAAGRRPDPEPDARHRCDAAQPAAGRLADVAADLRWLGLQPAGADQQGKRQEPAGRLGLVNDAGRHRSDADRA